MAEPQSFRRLGMIGGVAAGIFLMALVATQQSHPQPVSMSTVEAALSSMQMSSDRVPISDEKIADLKKHAVSGASLVNTKMAATVSPVVPTSPLESILGGSNEDAPKTNSTTGQQVTGIDPVTGKRIDTGDMPSFMFPILLAVGGTVVMIGVFTYMCCFKTETKPEGKRAPAPAQAKV